MMTTQQQRFERALQQALRMMDRRESIPAVMGDPDGDVYVAGRDNYVYVQVALPTGVAVWEVLCTKVTPQVGLEVFLRRNRYDTWEVVEEDPFNASSFWGGSGVTGNVGRHGGLHSWLASDPVQLSARQLAEFSVTPAVDGDGLATLSVTVGPYLYRYHDSWAFLSETTVDLASAVPTAVQHHRLVVVGLNKSTGEAMYVAGDATFSYATNCPFDGDDVAALLANTDTSFEPAAAVWLRTGQTRIAPAHIFMSCRGFERGGGGGTVLAWDVDNPPDAPSAYDDEFDDAAFDTSLWTEFDSGDIQTLNEAGTTLSLSQASQAGEHLTGIYQATPGSEFTIVAKIRLDAASVSGDGEYFQAGLALFDDAAGNDMVLMAGPVAYGESGATYNGFGVSVWSNQTTVSYPASVYSSFEAGTYYYLRIRGSSGYYHFDFSPDGENWTTAVHMNFTPAHIGLGLANEATGETIQAEIEFFRYRDVEDSVDDPVYGAGEITAPVDAQYLVLAADDTLTAERVLVAGDGLSGSDGGAGGSYTLAANVDDSTLEVAGDALQVKDGGITAAKLAGGAALSEILDDDGAGSGLDADLLDGQHASAFADASHNHAASDITSGTLAHERGGLEADVSAYGGLLKIDGGSTSELKCNFTAAAAPTANDDSGDGYSVGSRWFDVSGDKEYVCLDATVGAAVWTETTQSGGGGSGTSGTTVTNKSGAAVSAGDVGYLDAAGDFYTTTTEYDLVTWAVVTAGGAHDADITVLRRGRCTVTLNGNCSAGDYLYTSTSAGQAQPSSTLRPDVFAVALTANAGGAGGTCQALLLTGRTLEPVTSSTQAYLRMNVSSSETAWTGTIDDANPTTNPVTVSTSTGSISTITPTGTGLFKVVIRNTTRGDEALVDSVSGSDITFDAVPGTWQDGDSLTAQSDVVSTAGYYTLDCTGSGDIPAVTVGVVLMAWIQDTGDVGETFHIHPYATYGSHTGINLFNQNTSVYAASVVFVGLSARRIAFRTTASGSNTVTNFLRLFGVVKAVP